MTPVGQGRVALSSYYGGINYEVEQPKPECCVNQSSTTCKRCNNLIFLS